MRFVCVCVLCLRVQRPPFVIFERYSNGTISAYKGYCYEIIHALKSMYNFTYAKSIQQRQSANFGQSVEFFFGIQIRSSLARGQRLWKRIAKWQLEWHDWYDRRSGRNDPFIILSYYVNNRLKILSWNHISLCYRLLMLA